MYVHNLHFSHLNLYRMKAFPWQTETLLMISTITKHNVVYK